MSRESRRVFDKLLEAVVVSSAARRPGELIKKLSKKDREDLKELKSEDIQHRMGE